jgi:hypothetical protein
MYLNAQFFIFFYNNIESRREMDHSVVTHMEDLPVEILMKIFEYFTAGEIYLSFSYLNSCMPIYSLYHSMLKTSQHVSHILF